VKPGPWWRAQNSCVDHAKLIKLSDKAHRNWFNLVCLSSAHAGVLPDIATIAIKLRMTEARCAAAIAELVAARLFDKREDGFFSPHDWNEFQYKHDANDPTNARRQAEHRKKKAAEMKALRALLNQSRNPLHNGALRNTVTDVPTKRPETDKNITTTGYEDGKGLVGEREGRSSIPVSSELVAINARFKQ
jgi:hypothetical protein